MGLRAAVYKVRNLDRAKTWFVQSLRQELYFDEPYYVGFNVGGYKLGFDPDDTTGRPEQETVYWGMRDIEEALRQLIATGAEMSEDIRDVISRIQLVPICEPQRNLLGTIEHPLLSAS